MSHCWFHSLSSARYFGGEPEDYLRTHEWFDQVKVAWNFPTHRALLHNEFGVKLIQEIFGQTLVRQSDGKSVELEPLVRLHIEEDLGKVPSLADWLHDLRVEIRVKPVKLHEDFQSIVEFFRSPSLMWDSPRSLIVLHNTVGIYLCEQRFGQLFARPNGKVVPTRLIAEKLVQQRLGKIPTVQDWLQTLSLKPEWRRNAAAKLSERFDEGGSYDL